MILIIADIDDTHADSVELHLRKKKSDYFRLNLEETSLKETIISHEQQGWIVAQNGRRADSRLISAVWARRLSVYTDLEQENTPQTSSFRLWKGEWNRCLFGFYSSLREVFWLNRIDASTLVNNKIYQFCMAKEIGFKIPDYVYTNDKDTLIAFARRHVDIAIKFMAQDMYKMEDGSYAGLYVNKIGEKALEDFAGSQENPIFLQKYVNKKFEVRYTYVDGKGFACKIDSQSNKKTSVDWRRYDIPNTPHYEIQVPHEVHSLVTALMKKAGLAYGAFDFIVDNSDQWWYLEVNSGGQWLWIEDLTGLPISESIATCLERHSTEESI